MVYVVYEVKSDESNSFTYLEREMIHVKEKQSHPNGLFLLKKD